MPSSWMKAQPRCWQKSMSEKGLQKPARGRVASAKTNLSEAIGCTTAVSFGPCPGTTVWFVENELELDAAVLREFLAAQGCPFSTVMPTSETNISVNVVAVQFEVNEGLKSP